MGKREKLLQRLLSMPKDFTFEEMQSLLEALGYQRNNKGKTSGSRVMFIKDGSIIMLHKPWRNVGRRWHSSILITRE